MCFSVTLSGLPGPAPLQNFVFPTRLKKKMLFLLHTGELYFHMVNLKSSKGILKALPILKMFTRLLYRIAAAQACFIRKNKVAE